MTISHKSDIKKENTKSENKKLYFNIPGLTRDQDTCYPADCQAGYT